MPLHLKRVLNQARLDTEIYDTRVQHLERETELNGLSDPIDNNVKRIHQIDAQEQKQAPNPPKPAGRVSNAATPDTLSRTVKKRPAKHGTEAIECRTR